ncbi:MAG TPA: hypothetical protein VN285_13265 [Candidatus Deferrimicrobium sp.]|nr:hypothetical protein [Candidatus Deferrimicrobium sp.]
MKHRFFLALFCLAIFGAVPVSAQFVQDTIDDGVADSVEMVVSVVPNASMGQLKVQLDLWGFNDSNQVVGASMGFAWDNPNLQMDSAKASAYITGLGNNIGPFFYEDNDINKTNLNKRFLFGWAKLLGSAIGPSSSRRMFASYYFTLSNWSASDSIVVDTLLFSPATVYQFISVGNKIYHPYWLGKKVVYDPNRPANLIVSPDSLYFTAVQGGSSPPPQAFTISSDGAPLNFNIIESIPWAIPSPITGTTVKGINVLINIIGLTAGTYADSLRVESAGAANSPQYVKLVLVVTPPPPRIGASPSSFIFNAIAGGSNPAPKTLTIKNTGGSTLNWTVAKSQSWLTLVPTAGVDSGDVSVQVDITSLPFGTYYDTIVVADPAATNSPVRVPVTLTVASDLPVIAVDSSFNYIVVPSGVSSVPPRDILIKNLGGGTLNFSLSETSSRIFTLTPSSGTADQTVTVGFKIIGGEIGVDYYDTLWVNSNEAVNSPYPVVFLFHYVEEAALLSVTRDTIKFDIYQCDMGYGNEMPSVIVGVSNLGGDDPLPYVLLYESMYFTTDVDSGVAPSSFMVTASDLQLPLGPYYDTILVVAQKAFNNPKTVIVKFNMIAGTTQPQIHLLNTYYPIPAQENGGPQSLRAFAVYNRYGGCMPWEITENVPWMDPEPDSGDVVGESYLAVDGSGYVFGQYPDSFFVHAPSASNTPRRVLLLLQVWRFHGDWDYNAEINIADLVANVDFLFNSGPFPQPEIIVGDLDCNFMINVADLTYFVDYMFNHGPIPCGNPY